MSDVPRVTVPTELVDKLRLAVRGNERNRFYVQSFRAARALVDAAERPDEYAVGVMKVQAGDTFMVKVGSSAAPVSEPLCRCGHDKGTHEYEYSPVKGHCSHGGTNGVPECRCARFRPPVPVSDEAEAAASKSWSRMGVEFVEGKRTMLPGWNHYAPAFIAGFRAARQAGKDER